MRAARLKLSAAALVEGIEVRALDDARALAAAAPVGEPGKLKLDPLAVERRQAAMARRLGQAGGEVVVILGAAHDLAAVLRRAGVRAEVRPVTVPAVKALVGE
jgi:hypothetical protein